MQKGNSKRLQKRMMTQSRGPSKNLPTTFISDASPLEPDRQIQDDLANWGVPRVEPTQLDYFHHDTLISDEDVQPTPKEETQA